VPEESLACTVIVDLEFPSASIAAGVATIVVVSAAAGLASVVEVVPVLVLVLGAVVDVPETGGDAPRGGWLERVGPAGGA
jgi:hypothetical protein